jgi:cytochrome c oxidase assembly protein subunit 11
MPDQRSNKKLAYSFIMVVIAMIFVTYASVPIYSLFCKLTGFGGTPLIATNGFVHTVGKKLITVRFDANVNPGLDWAFKPEQDQVKIKVGENALVFYSAQNLTTHPVKGTAVYNVTPHKAGQYFVKIECFCFQEQTLGAGENKMMPVSFYIDPAIEKDEDLQDVNTITLSYSFFKV